MIVDFKTRGEGHDRFIALINMFSMIEYSYTSITSGWRASFDERLASDGVSDTNGIKLYTITETLSVDTLGKAINNSLNASTAHISLSVTTLKELLTSFSWRDTPEGVDFWRDAYQNLHD